MQDSLFSSLKLQEDFHPLLGLGEKMFVDHLIQKFRKDVKRLQGNFLKEKENFVQKIHKLNFKKNLQEKKEEIEKTALENFKKIGPIYQKITDDLSKKVKQAGLDLKVLERKLSPEKKTAKNSPQKTTKAAKKNPVKKTFSRQKSTKKVTKKTSANKITKKTKPVEKASKKVIKKATQKKLTKKSPSTKRTR